MQISRRSRQKFQGMCASLGTVGAIEDLYEAQGFELPFEFEPQDGRARRSVCEASESGIDVHLPEVPRRLLRVYLDGVEDFGRRTPAFFETEPSGDDDPLWPEARALVRSLQRDGFPVDDDGDLVGSAQRSLAVDQFERLSEPGVILEHLTRIEASIDSDPAAAIGSAKELVESTCKFILEDYEIAYERGADLPELYRLAAAELEIDRDAVPHSAKGSASAKKALQNAQTLVQSVAELRNELGVGHGKTRRSPARPRHARLAANAARTVIEFMLETWHERREPRA